MRKESIKNERKLERSFESARTLLISIETNGARLAARFFVFD